MARILMALTMAHHLPMAAILTTALSRVALPQAGHLRMAPQMAPLLMAIYQPGVPPVSHLPMGHHQPLLSHLILLTRAQALLKGNHLLMLVKSRTDP